MGPNNYNLRGETVLSNEDAFDLHKSNLRHLSQPSEETEEPVNLRWIAGYRADVDKALKTPTEEEIAVYSGRLTVHNRTAAVEEYESKAAA